MNVHVVTFLDHSIGLPKPTICRAIGEVIAETKTYIVLRYWTCLKEDEATPINDLDNDEHITIIKSTILDRQMCTAFKDF